MKLLCRVFRSANFSFRQKKAIKFEIWTLFTCLKEIYQFLGGWFGKLLSGLAQTFQDPLVPQNETPVKVFWLSIFTFQTKESNKIWNLDPLRLLERNLPILGGLIWKAAFSFGQHIPQPFSVTKKKLLWEALLQAASLSNKKPNKIWNLDPTGMLLRNRPILGWLIWKAAFNFGPNIPRPFSVTKWNSCEEFLAQPTYLSDKRKQ